MIALAPLCAFAEDPPPPPPPATTIVVGDGGSVIVVKDQPRMPPPEGSEWAEEEEEEEDWDEEDDDDVYVNDQNVVAQYGMQLLPQSPGHQVALRLEGDDDAYLLGELRYMPGHDFVGIGRLGAGFDFFHGDGVDLTLGAFLGAGGEWEYTSNTATLWATQVIGTEVAFGLEGEHLFGKYRWLAGLGGGPMADLLTENEITLGYKVGRTVHVYGQYLVLTPGRRVDRQDGVGLGVRIAL